MSNDWTNKLRDRMTDYQEPVKDDLWAAIEQSLAQQSQEIHHPQELQEEPNTSIRIFSLRRLSIAAAIATLAVGGSYVFLHPWGENTDAQVASVLNTNQRAQKAFDKNTKSSLTESANAGVAVGNFSEHHAHESVASSMAPRKVVSHTHRNSWKSTDEFALTSEVSTYASDDAVLGQAANSVSEKKYSADVASKELRNSDASQSSRRVEKKNGNNNDFSRGLYGASYQENSKKSQNTLALNLYGENGFVIDNASGNQVPFQQADAMADPMQPAFTASNNEYAPVFDSKVVGLLAAQEYKQEAKHHLPISIGLQVGFGIVPRLRLTTGVVYTKASSDFIVSAHNNATVTTQELHYVGIPLNLSYEVWGTKQFHTYVTVGGEGDINVKNNTKTDGMSVSCKRDRMQWSGKASVGAQFDVIPQLGIYVEPGAKYYFDNGSQIENTFKDKKLNFNFQFGLRWNVGK